MVTSHVNHLIYNKNCNTIGNTILNQYLILIENHHTTHQLVKD